MTLERPALERRVLDAVTATPPRIPVLLGGCGSGRTTVLLRLLDQFGIGTCQHIDVERCVATPERFTDAILASSPFPAVAAGGQSIPREAFDATLVHFDRARTAEGLPATFLLDEVLELRTFESFPGLRSVMPELFGALAQSANRFVLTSRYVSRALRVLRDASPAFEVVHMPALTATDVRAALPNTGEHRLEEEQHEMSRALQTLADGRPAYVQILLEGLAALEQEGGHDPVAALRTLLAPGAALDRACRFSYELRLHRARGYGALKAILDVLAEDEPLTLTVIAQRLRRTPGSTKDYLSWLQDVDLIVVRQKRYSIADPLMRLWLRLHRRTVPPSPADIAREVHDYALSRLPQPDVAVAAAGLGAAGDEAARKTWGIIEID